MCSSDLVVFRISRGAVGTRLASRSHRYRYALLCKSEGLIGGGAKLMVAGASGPCPVWCGAVRGGPNAAVAGTCRSQGLEDVKNPGPEPKLHARG